jgi:carbonic anhydrase/SulP family sulfate permease
VLIDARNCDYIDPDILDLIHDFRTQVVPARQIELSVLGFKDHYPDLPDQVRYAEHATVDVQRSLSCEQVLALLQEGNRRFLTGRQLNRDYRRQVSATAPGQAPLAVVLSCMDSRAPIELVCDLGIGDAFSVRVAGNVAAPKVLGSLEYGCSVAGAKLLVVLGHTACGAVTAAVAFREEQRTALEATGCDNIDHVVRELDKSIDEHIAHYPHSHDAKKDDDYIDLVSRTNVLRTMAVIRSQSNALTALIEDDKLGLVGGIYDVRTGHVEFFDEQGRPVGASAAA